MMEIFSYQSEEAITRNLKDAGCDADTITQFLDYLREGKVAEELRILSGHRCHLLCELHDCQKRIDCLDYLIYQLKSKAGNEV